jgi:hypothetical protein
MSSSISLTFVTLARVSLLGGLLNRSGLPRIYMVVHSVCHPILFALHGKYITVLGELS